MFVKTFEKLRDRSPLEYNLTSSLSPTQISTLSEAIIIKGFNTLMELTVESKREDKPVMYITHVKLMKTPNKKIVRGKHKQKSTMLRRKGTQLN